jgi:hypothetical protein
MPEATLQPQQHYEVEITPGPTVNVEPVRISKKGRDIITWRCNFDPNWTVSFGAGSPFQDTGQGPVVFNRTHDTSGPIRKEAVEGLYYKYTVTAGGKSFDPGVIVNP